MKSPPRNTFANFHDGGRAPQVPFCQLISAKTSSLPQPQCVQHDDGPDGRMATSKNWGEAAVDQQQTSWYIEGAISEGGPTLRFNIGKKPVMVGRQLGVDLVIRNDSVSRRHAEVYIENGSLWVRDCGSSNGTFVNRQRITGPVPLNVGDVIHFATVEFLVGCDETIPSSSGLDTITISGVLPANYPIAREKLLELVREERVRTIFEPIVTSDTREVWAFEALGRGAMESLPESPLELFALAGPLGLQAELSRVFRRMSMRQAPSPLPAGGLFLNVHPTEMEDTALLLASLRAIRREHPTIPLVLEIPEMLVTNDASLAALRERLHELDVALAYDDFGAGQARLVELTRVPPQYLKFDKLLVADLANPGMRVREMLEMLVSFAHDLGVRCVAEGVATFELAEAARDVGFDYLQGHCFGSPSVHSTVTPIKPFD